MEQRGVVRSGDRDFGIWMAIKATERINSIAER